MTRVLVFDTETTGLPPRNGRLYAWVTDAAAWDVCRLVQLAYETYDYDETDGTATLLERRDFTVRPEGFEIPEAATKVHGISTQHALEHGVPLSEALDALAAATSDADTLVSHNNQFDDMVIQSELYRLGRKRDVRAWTRRERADTMLMGTLQHQRWPKLAFLYRRCFGRDPEGQMHSAGADTTACAEIYFHLLKTTRYATRPTHMVAKEAIASQNDAAQDHHRDHRGS